MMTRKVLVKTALLLVLAQLCYADILLESLETRLCRAQFVFKFQVVSASRRVCFRPLTNTKTTTQPLPPAPTTTTLKTTNTTPLTNTTTLQRTSNLTAATPTNRSHNSTTQSAKSTKLSTSIISPPKTRRKRCIPLPHQNIIIDKQRVFRGSDKLKKIKAVKEILMKEISYSAYYSYIRLDLNFHTDLPLGDYLFVGRQIGKIEDQVFLKNPSTVQPWSKKLEQRLNKFDFVKDCKRQNNS